MISSIKLKMEQKDSLWTMRGVVLKESLLYIFNLFVRRLGINLVIEDNFIL